MQIQLKTNFDHKLLASPFWKRWAGEEGIFLLVAFGKKHHMRYDNNQYLQKACLVSKAIT